MIYSFAGCVMEGANFLAPFLPGRQTSIRGINTDGVLRLLSGESIVLDPTQAKRFADVPARYAGLDSAAVKGILWTPVNDAIFLLPRARCEDRSTYPIYDGGVDAVLGSTGASLSWATIDALWRRLREVSLSIPFTGIVSYPTDHLASSAWKERIDRAQNLAAIIFDSWQHFAIEPELAEPDGYWAHYSQAAKERLWARIKERLP